MAQTKPKFMLVEHGRYFYQRRVPLEFQRAIGRKKWRAPLGDDFDAAYDRLGELRDGHNALLQRLKDPEERRDYQTGQRRKREADENVRIAAEDAAYERWCHANSLRTEEEEYSEFVGEDDEPVWEKVDRWLEALGQERTRHMPPSPKDVERIDNLIARLTQLDDEYSVSLPPFPEYQTLVSHAKDAVRCKISFRPALPEPMDDDEYHDRLVELHRQLFGEDTGCSPRFCQPTLPAWNSKEPSCGSCGNGATARIGTLGCIHQ